MTGYSYTKEEAARLKRGDDAEYYDGRRWITVEVLSTLRDAGSHKGLTVRVTNGTYETEAAPGELRP